MTSPAVAIAIFVLGVVNILMIILEGRRRAAEAEDFRKILKAIQDANQPWASPPEKCPSCGYPEGVVEPWGDKKNADWTCSDCGATYPLSDPYADLLEAELREG